MQDTRYHIRLKAKLEELNQVYCSDDFPLDIYRALVQDQEFVDMLQSVWKIELSESILSLYRMLVLYRQPLVRTNTGYHVPSREEVIADIRAFFDPAHLSGDATPSTPCIYCETQHVRAEIISIFRGIRCYTPDIIDYWDVQGFLLASIRNYVYLLPQTYCYVRNSNLLDRGRDFTVPAELSEALSKATTLDDISRIRDQTLSSPSLVELGAYVGAWFGIQASLEASNSGEVCECPYIYYLVQSCLSHGTGVPKLALALYNRMNMELSREFIRCANPTCKHNKVDQSTGQVKFKKCSRCKAVLYCSRECQIAHYPYHKRLCREYAPCQEES